MNEDTVYGLAVSYYTNPLGPLHPNKIDEYRTREEIIKKCDGIKTEEFVNDMINCLNKAVKFNYENRIGGYETVHAHLYYFRSYAHAQACDFALGGDKLDDGILSNLIIAIYNPETGNFTEEDDEENLKSVLVNIREAANLFEKAGYKDHRLSMDRVVKGPGFGLMSDFIDMSEQAQEKMKNDNKKNVDVKKVIVKEEKHVEEKKTVSEEEIEQIKQRKKEKKRRKKAKALNQQ